MISQIYEVPGIKNTIKLIDLEYLNSLPDPSKKIETDVCLKTGGFYSTPQGIVVLNDVCVLMSKDNIMAILYHEDAHLQLGHFTHEVVKEGSVIIDNLASELEADAYAANIVGNSVMAAAIIELIQSLAKVMACIKPKFLADTMAKSMVGHQTTQKRLLALNFNLPGDLIGQSPIAK